MNLNRIVNPEASKPIRIINPQEEKDNSSTLEESLPWKYIKAKAMVNSKEIKRLWTEKTKGLLFCTVPILSIIPSTPKLTQPVSAKIIPEK